MSHFAINLGQTAEDSDMFTNIWLSSIGLKNTTNLKQSAPDVQFHSYFLLLSPTFILVFFPTFSPNCAGQPGLLFEDLLAVPGKEEAERGTGNEGFESIELLERELG